MRRIATMVLAALAIASCGKDENKLASRYLKAASDCIGQSDYQQAKIYIDSVKIVYPKAFEARREGIRLMQQVELAEAERTLAYQDSALAVLNSQLNEIKTGFVFSKDEEYQDLGLYTVASQALEKNAGQNYIRGMVDEKGRMTLVSNFHDAAYIHHRSLRLSAGDDYVDTPVSDDFYEFKDLGICYEKCNFTDGNDGGAAAFVALNRNARIQVRLNGSRQVLMTMRSSDRDAIAGLYSLSLLIKSIVEATGLREEALRKIRFVNENIARTSSGD